MSPLAISSASESTHTCHATLLHSTPLLPFFFFFFFFLVVGGVCFAWLCVSALHPTHFPPLIPSPKLTQPKLTQPNPRPSPATCTQALSRLLAILCKAPASGWRRCQAGERARGGWRERGECVSAFVCLCLADTHRHTHTHTCTRVCLCTWINACRHLSDCSGLITSPRLCPPQRTLMARVVSSISSAF